MTAALKVFAEKGFQEASNRDIAKAAALATPALIYHYFPSKLELLRAIVEAHSPISQVIDNSEWLLAQPPEITLTRIGEMYVDLYASHEASLLMKVIFGEALHNPEFAETFAQIGPLKMLGFLSQYFGNLMDQGILKRTDPDLAARGFAGPFVTLFVFRTVFGRQDPLPVDAKTLVSNNVQTFLYGLAAKNP